MRGNVGNSIVRVISFSCVLFKQHLLFAALVRVELQQISRQINAYSKIDIYQLCSAESYNGMVECLMITRNATTRKGLGKQLELNPSPGEGEGSNVQRYDEQQYQGTKSGTSSCVRGESSHQAVLSAVRGQQSSRNESSRRQAERRAQIYKPTNGNLTSFWVVLKSLRGDKHWSGLRCSERITMLLGKDTQAVMSVWGDGRSQQQAQGLIWTGGGRQEACQNLVVGLHCEMWAGKEEGCQVLTHT